MDNFDKIIIALPYLINVLSILMPDISTIITNIHQKPVVFKYRVLIVIYYSHLFLYIKFSLRVLNNLLLYIYIYIYIIYINYIYILIFKINFLNFLNYLTLKKNLSAWCILQYVFNFPYFIEKRTFIELQNKTLKVSDHLQVNEITQSTLSHA